MNKRDGLHIDPKLIAMLKSQSHLNDVIRSFLKGKRSKRSA
jgi:hypothetical protein